MRKKVITEIISSLLVLLFLYASLSKFFDFRHFIGQMNNQPFPNWMTPYLVWSIPSLEIAITVALIFEKTRTPGLYASLILMAAFTIYTVAILLRFFGRIPCSCGGVIEKLTWQQHLALNLFFVAIALAGILLRRPKVRQYS